MDAVCDASVEKIRELTADALDSESDGSSESGTSAFSTDSLTDALEDLQMDTTCLIDLDSLLGDSIALVGAETICPDRWETWHPSQVYIDKINTRFPEADHFLVQQLGTINYDRYLRCQKARNLNWLMDVSPASATDKPDGASSKFHDSGIGSSLPTTYAETAMSYGADEIRRVRLPPLPTQAKNGVPFACVCCGKSVTIRTNRAWKQHLYEDLQPWVCLDAECPNIRKTFRTRKDWISHLALDHGLEPDWVSMRCPLCHHYTGSGKTLIATHLSSHLEEISLAVLPTNYDSDEESASSELEDGNLENGVDGQRKLLIDDMHKAAASAGFEKIFLGVFDASEEYNTSPSSPRPDHVQSPEEEQADDGQILRSMSQSERSIGPFKCQEPGCAREFKLRSQLLKHEQLHSLPWKCPEKGCSHDLGYASKKDLNRHLRIRHIVSTIYKRQFHPFESDQEVDYIRHMETGHDWQRVPASKTGETESNKSSQSKDDSISVGPAPTPLVDADFGPSGFALPDPPTPEDETQSSNYRTGISGLADRNIEQDDHLNTNGLKQQDTKTVSAGGGKLAIGGLQDFDQRLPQQSHPLVPDDHDDRAGHSFPSFQYGLLTSSNLGEQVVTASLPLCSTESRRRTRASRPKSRHCERCK